jgi:uncharacterized membrane protein YqhA
MAAAMSPMPAMDAPMRLLLSAVGVVLAFAMAGVSWIVGVTVYRWFSEALDAAAEEIR